MCRTISKPRILTCRRMCVDFHELPHPCNSSNKVFNYLPILPQKTLKTNSVTYLVRIDHAIYHSKRFNVCPYRQEKVHRSNVTGSRSEHKRCHTILMHTNKSKEVTYYTVTRLGGYERKLIIRRCLP